MKLSDEDLHRLLLESDEDHRRSLGTFVAFLAMGFVSLGVYTLIWYSWG